MMGGQLPGGGTGKFVRKPDGTAAPPSWEAVKKRSVAYKDPSCEFLK